MKVSELTKILVKDGWYIHRHGKKHDIYRHPTKPEQISLERHQSSEIANGTCNKILKTAGLK